MYNFAKNPTFYLIITFICGFTLLLFLETKKMNLQTPIQHYTKEFENIRRETKNDSILELDHTQKPMMHQHSNRTEKPWPRVLCWVLTDPKDLPRRTIHVKNTWSRRCDVRLFMSSKKDKRFPTVGLQVAAGRNHIAAKAKAAWKYIYKHHIYDADFFVKADPDTYMIIENLKEYLSHFNHTEALYFGHRFFKPEWDYTYMSGGPGVVLTRESVERLVTKAWVDKKTRNCMPDGQGEDYKTASCLTKVGAKPVDTRDSEGKERFMVFQPATHITGGFPGWYPPRDPSGALKGDRCCSRYPISFHYITPNNMHVLEYFLYRARPHGKEYTHNSTSELPII